MAGADSNTGNDKNSKRRTGSGNAQTSKNENTTAASSLGITPSKQGESDLHEASRSVGPGYGEDPARPPPVLQSLNTVPDSLEAHRTPFNTPISQLPPAAPLLPSSLNPVPRQIRNLEAEFGTSIPKSRRAPYNGKDNVQDYDPGKLDEVLTAVGFTGEPEMASLGTHGAAQWAGREDRPSDSTPETDLTTTLDKDDPGDSEETVELLEGVLSPGLIKSPSTPRKRDFEAFEGMTGPSQSKEHVSPPSIPKKPVATPGEVSPGVAKDPAQSSSSQAQDSSPHCYSPGAPTIWAADVVQTGQLEEAEPRMSLDSVPGISLLQTSHSEIRSLNEISPPVVLPETDDEKLLSTGAQTEGAKVSHLWQASDFTSQDPFFPIVHDQSDDADEETIDPNGEAHMFVHPIERESGDGLGAHRILRGADHPARVGSNQPIPYQPFPAEQQLKQLAAKRKLEENMKQSGHVLAPEIEKMLETKEHPAIKAFSQYASTRQGLEGMQLGLAAMNEALADGHKVTIEKLSAEQTISTLRVATQKSVDTIRKLSAEKHAREKADKEDPDFKDRDRVIVDLRKQIKEKDDFLLRSNAHWLFQVRQLERDLKDAEKTKDELDRCLENNRDKEERINKLQNAISGDKSLTEADQTEYNLSDRQGEDSQTQGASVNQAAGLEAERIVLENIVAGIQANIKGYSHGVLKTDGSLVTQFKSIEYYIDMTLQQFHDASIEISDAKQALDTINTNFGFGRLLNVPSGQLQSVTNFRYKYHTLSEIIEELISRICDMSSTAPDEEKHLGHGAEKELNAMRDDKKGQSRGHQPATGGPIITNFAKSQATKDLEEELEATKKKLEKVKETWKGIEPAVYHELEDMLEQEKRNVEKLEKQLAKSNKLVEVYQKDASQLRRDVKNLDKQVKLSEEIRQHDKARLELDKARLEKEIAELKNLIEKLRAEKAATRVKSRQLRYKGYTLTISLPDRRDSGFSADRKPYQPTQLAIDFALIRCDAALKAMVNKRLVYGFEYGDAEEAIEAALLAITLSEKCQDEALTARSNFWAGVAHYYSDDLGNALLHFKNAQKGKKWTKPVGERRMLDLWVVRGANLPVPKDAGNYGGKPGSRRQSSMDSKDGNVRRRRSKGLVKLRPGSSGSMN